jgi:hypothetical protein
LGLGNHRPSRKQRLLSDFVIEVKTTVDVKLQTAARKSSMMSSTRKDGLPVQPGRLSTMTPEGASHRGRRNYERFNRATNRAANVGVQALFIWRHWGYTPDEWWWMPISVGGWRRAIRENGGRITMMTAWPSPAPGSRQADG